MSDKNEPAFPVQDCAAFQYSGMTLRDYFAGQALAGFAASGRRIGKWNDGTVATCCYEIADALLLERERGQ